jgi:hypothetical protein
MPVVKIIASSCSDFKQAVASRRQALEQVRMSNLRRMKSDFEKISKRETEYVQKVVELIAPVKVSWNQDAWQKLQQFIPIQVEPISYDSPSESSKPSEEASENAI